MQVKKSQTVIVIGDTLIANGSFKAVLLHFAQDLEFN